MIIFFIIKILLSLSFSLNYVRNLFKLNQISNKIPNSSSHIAEKMHNLSCKINKKLKKIVNILALYE
jgi:hypothetical protein